MKKFTKIMLIIAGVMTSIGVFCMILAFAFGFTGNKFVEMFQDNKFSFGFVDYEEENDGAIPIDEECKNLDIEFGAGTLEIYYDDVEQIQIEKHNMAAYKIYVENETLYIDGDTKVTNNSDSALTIILPQKTVFQKVEMDLGASEACINQLVADTFEIEVGAGEATIYRLDVKNLDAEVGVGRLVIEMNGKQTDYNYHIECGIGEIQIGENSYGGFGAEQKIKNENASKQMNVACGIGEIDIEFME